jgi:predicted patatin/cPLA2 family phospholipase
VTQAHTPALAAGDDAAGSVRRSLLLAGGGMRVAYQAGVLVALERAGLTFFHADGTSGGTINLAMLLSGVSPGEACERWRTLDVRGFVSLPSLRWLRRGPPYPALGSSDGIRSRVYPHLGIDPERIRAARGIQGTFNVCDYTQKVNVAVAHQEVDRDILVAGVSLPILSPVVHHSGAAYVDSVWIKDVNVGEAVRRGADELWLVWAIGNHGVYRNGVFQQYVHMIEMSANGSLFEELAAVRRLNDDRPEPIRLHVVRPRVPLPLDPDFLFGRVDAATLIAMGHRDACEYLDRRAPEGVPFGPQSTRMTDPRPGVGFRETLAGDVGGALTARIAWEVDDLDAFARHPEGTVVGDVTHPAVGTRALARGGEFARDGGQWRVELRLEGARLQLRRTQRRWREVDAALVDASGAVIGRGRLLARAAPWRTLHARGVGSLQAGGRALARFARMALTSGW